MNSKTLTPTGIQKKNTLQLNLDDDQSDTGSYMVHLGSSNLNTSTNKKFSKLSPAGRFKNIPGDKSEVTSQGTFIRIKDSENALSMF